jgi:hypothetical protein
VRSRGALSIGLTLAALIVGGWRFILPFGSGGGNPPAAVTHLIGQIVQSRGQNALPAFQSATAALDGYRAAHETYAGAALPPSTGVLVLDAGTTSYCLQTGSGAATVHELEPVGNLNLGPCPA